MSAKTKINSTLSIINPSPVKIPGPGLLHQLVNTSLTSKALDHLEQGVRTCHTYKELHRAADGIALQVSEACGFPDGQFVVPVLIQQSPLLYVALLGILKAGGAFCPLNTDAPPERVNFILGDVSAQIFLVSEELVSKVPPSCSANIIIVKWEDESSDKTTSYRTPASEDLAYVMYTSGSTGTPKGVGMSHGAATQALLAHDKHIPAFSRFLQFAAPTFDVSVFEIFFPLFRGATLVSVRRNEMLDDLPAVMREMEVDGCELTPTVAGSLLRNRDNVPSLKLLLTIGEMLSQPVVKEFGGSENVESMLWAMYGPTEAAIHCTLQTSMQSSSTVNNIGTPLETVSCFVIELENKPNSEFKILPRGEVGELAVGGYQLANGYLNRPSQTAAAFISSPYGRLYRTGDKARIHVNGTLECLGRLSDGQVKLRGQRLEIGEVETAIIQTPGVHGAVVIVENSILVAFCAGDTGVSEDAVLESCKSWLPQFMVPGEVIVMQDFPRLPSGKVDKKKLRADFVHKKTEQPTIDVGLDALPDDVLNILSKVLKVSPGDQKPLVFSGVDSLMAIRLASSLRSSGFEIKATDLMSLRSMSDLWTSIQQNKRGKIPNPTLGISYLGNWDDIVFENPDLEDMRDLVDDIFPCTPLQAAMVSEPDRMDRAYWNSVELETDAETTPDQVAKALRQLIRENEILRTGFLSWGSKTVSVLFKDMGLQRIRIGDKIDHHAPKGMFPRALNTLSIDIEKTVLGKGPRIWIAIHHAIYDGWSLDMLLSDLSALIRGFQPTHRGQFRDVIAFYEKKRPQSLQNAAITFWADHLAGWSKTRYPEMKDRGSWDDGIKVTNEMLNIPFQRVKKASMGVGCSVQVFFQAALALVWSNILGNSDIVLGIVTSGRTIPVAGIENIMGPCIASMPLRVDFSKMTKNVHLLNHIHSSNRAMMEHYALSLSEVQNLIHWRAGDSLYDILFVYQESPESDLKRKKVVREVRHKDWLDLKLLLEVEPREGGFALQMSYDATYSTSEMVHQIIDQIKAVVLSLVENSRDDIHSTVRKLSVDPSIHNQHPTPYAGVPDLASMFEKVVDGAPNAKALCFGRYTPTGSIDVTTLTYQGLNQLSNRIAHLLRSQGVGSGEVVAIVMEKSINLYASILAILKTGCAYLPLLPSTPTARVADIFSQANVRYCIADTAALESLPPLDDISLVNIDTASLGNSPNHNLNTTPDGARLAYVIYTSGTTGKPKGVAVTQLNIGSNISHLEKTYPKSTRKQSRLLQACSQAFDVSVFEIFYTWHAGMCLCTGTNDTIFEDLERAIRDLEITHLSLTPTVASLIQPWRVPDVEFIVTAGEAMTWPVLSSWGKLLWQGYGPSETTNICSVKKMIPQAHIEHLGWTFPNTSAFVLFPNSLDVAPLGWVGEFCFGGDQIAQGYLNLPQTTAQSFIEHPKFGRLYRSGDMGRMLSDGSLIILGRIDLQLKLRGQRIEPGEVNSHVTDPTVATSAVTMLGRRDKLAAEQLITFYVPARHSIGDGVLDPDVDTTRQIFRRLQSSLPTYMVPSYLIPVSHIPLTSSGKVDRRCLQTWFEGLSSSRLESATAATQHTDNESDSSPTELSITETIAQYLDIPTSSLDRWTPFATLGLNSVTASGLARGLSTKVGNRIPISAILQNPTVIQLGNYIDNQPSPQPQPSSTRFFDEGFADMKKKWVSSNQPVEMILPCTPLQEAMLIGTGNYYNKILLRLQVSPEDMRRYWDEMTRRHGILRTYFEATDITKRGISQHVLESWTIPWLEYDVSAPSFDDVVQNHLKQLPEPVDSEIPPVSLAVIRHKGSAFLSFICHHALYDGVAMNNLWKEIEALANGMPLPPAVSYAPFLGEMLILPDDTERFWATQFLNFQPTSLFSRSSRKNVDQAFNATTLGIPLSSLNRHIQILGVSLLSLCQAAWADTLAVAYDAPDVCFGNVLSGRTVDVPDIDKLIAPCFNTIPIRRDVSTHAHWMDLVKHFFKLSSDILPYQFTPLRLVQKLGNAQGYGLFDTLLLLQQPLIEMDNSVWTLESDKNDIDVPLVCEIVPCPGLDTLVINMQYDLNIVTSDVATTLAGIFGHLIESIISSPYATIMQRQSLPEKLQLGLQELKPIRHALKIRRTKQPSNEPWRDIERQIQQVLSELYKLPTNRITRHTTIFELGLDSINAIQVASILKRLGLDVSASDVIECPTCAKLADRLLENTSHVNTASIATYDFENFAKDVAPQLEGRLLKDGIEAIRPCTPLQSAMMTSFIQSGGQNYFNALTFNLETWFRGLENSFTTLQNRHPMLRSGFVSINHPHCAFAMVRSKVATLSLPYEVILSGDTETVDLERYKMELSTKFLENPCLPLWHVLIVQGAEQVTMTIFIHHALYDAHSLNSILDNLSMLIKGRVDCYFEKLEPGLAEIMNNTLGDHSDAEIFWKGKAQSVVVNRFPILTPLREVGGEMLVETALSSMTFSDLQKATQGAAVTIQAVIQAAWTRLLAAYLGESSVTFGVTLSNRATDATKDAPLPCLSTVPIVASTHTSNAELLSYMMNFNTKLHRLQSAPLSQVQRWLDHPASPVFDTLLSYRKIRQSGINERAFEMVRDDATIEYPVSLEIEGIERGEIRLSITYKTDVVPTEQAKLMLQQFDALMTNIARHPSGTAEDLYKTSPSIFSMLSPEIPEMDAPVQLLHQFVEIKALSQPEVVALEFFTSIHGDKRVQKQQWTYRELNEMGNRVAHMLLEHASVGSIVAIYFDKCPEAYFAILGILKAGCSFVALDPTAPKDRKEFILQDSRAPCLLAGPANLGFGDRANVIYLTTDSLLQFPATQRDLSPLLTPASPCYCLYTSGTTGTPKGCEITHENAVQAMMAFQELFRGHWDSDSRWLQFAALHFDVSVLEQYWSWSVGITVVTAPKDLILDDLTGSINKLGITHIDLTPSLARLTHPDEVPSLCKGVFITGGESLKQEILDAWGPKAVIYNAYGPTEATIGVTMYQRVPVNGRPSNIGKQFFNVGSYVFRPGTEIPVLKGGVGELCVSGKLVGKGYLGRPELTEERFPTLGEFNERVYRTGDFVRLLHDGCFDFLGRADDQVKLRGQRLEIGEINHAIRSVLEISDAATIVTSQGFSDKSILVAFVVSKSKKQEKEALEVLPDVEGLGLKAKEACRYRLPGYMVPTFCLRLPHIPLSVNNKAEVKELKRIFQELSREKLIGLTSTPTLPMTGVVSEIVNKIVQVLLEFSNLSGGDVTPSASIFDVGVDSISALRLSSILKSRGLSKASPTIILRNPVVIDLAQALSVDIEQNQDRFVKEAKQAIWACKHRYRASVCREFNLKPEEIEYIAPCSPLQQGIISKSLTSDTRGTYFNSFKLKLHDSLELKTLRQAWNELISAESILRTVFFSTTDGHVQVALRNKDVPWESHEFREHKEIHGFLDAKMRDWVASNELHITKPLQLIYAQTPTSRILAVHVFHAIYDGNSLDLMLKRIFTSVSGKEASRGPPFLDALIQGPLWKFDHCRNFWVEHLNSWSSSQTPVFSSPAAEVVISATRTLSYCKLEELRQAQNVTLQSVILALWTSVLQRYHPGGLTIGIIVSGRSIDLSGVENTIGPVFNTVPFFNGATSTWASLIRKTYQFGTAILPFQHVPLQKIQKWCSKGHPLFDNLFNFQIEGEDGGQTAPWEVFDGAPNAEYPLALEVQCMRNGKMQLSVVAQGHLVNIQGLGSLLDLIEENMALMVANDDSIFADLGTQAATPQSMETSTEISTDPSTMNDESDQEVARRFPWNTPSLTIRDEVAKLAGVDVSNITEATSMMELGLDSIDIIKLSTKLGKRGLKIPASQIMRRQTIAKLVEIKTDGTDASLDDAPKGADLADVKLKLWTHLKHSGQDMVNVETVSPPTSLQDSMVAAMVESGFEWYFNHDVMEIQAGVDVEKLREAWMRVIEAFPILRTGFVEIEDPDLDFTYCQVVYKKTHPWIGDEQVKDWSGMDQLMEESKLLATKNSAKRDLLQLKIGTLGEQKYLLLSIAHALYDGWSLGLIHREIQNAYNGGLISTTSPELFLKRVNAVQRLEATQFWADYLQDAMPTLIPRSSDKPPSIVYRAEKQSASTLKSIQAFCKQTSISLQVLCQACWGLVLAQRTQQLDVTFGVVLSGRDFEGAESLLFPTMNTVAVRCILHGSVESLLRYLEDNMGDVREFQGFPLRKARAAVRKGGELFNSLFMLQKTAENSSDGAFVKSVGGASALDYPVCVEAEAVAGRLIWRAACQSENMSQEDTAGLLSALDQVMKILISSPEAEILLFDNSGISICGLPSITLKEDVKIDHTTLVREEHTWYYTSTMIRNFLSQVSGIPKEAIKLSDTLFHLGLDSISAIKVSSLLRRQSIILSVRDLIRASDIRAMAVTVNKQAPPPDELQTGNNELSNWMPTHIDVDALLGQHNLSRTDVEAILPALPMQVYMLGAWQNANGSVFYPKFSYFINSTCTKDVIDKAWKSVVDSTPMLRTAFIATKSKEFPVLQVVLKHTAAAAQPMINFVVCWDVRKHGWVFKLKIHHALYDGFSLPAIIQKLSRRISGLVNTADTLVEWSKYVINTTSEAATSARRDFWTRYLQDCPRVKISAAHSIERVSYLQRSALQNVRCLQQNTAQYGVSLQSIFLAAYAKVLSAEEKHPVVIFGIYLANRSEEGLPDTYPRLNLVPLRVDVRGTLVNISRNVHSDVMKIGERGRANVGLWEIEAWTGVRVTSFVNFLSLPGVQDVDGVTITPCEDETTAFSYSETSKVCDIIVKNAFPPAMDIEAALNGDDLDVGIFGSKSRLPDDTVAPALVSKITAVLQGR